MPEQQSIQAKFLNNFVRNIIENFPKKNNEESTKNAPPASIIFSPQKIEPPAVNYAPVPAIKFQSPAANYETGYEKVAPFSIKSTKEMVKENAWSKIQTLVKNKNIQIIECPGPDKPILIHEKGSLAKISLSMSEEEIITLLKTIAQENAVPFMHGVMKIKSQNYNLTAVISEFAGSRFIIYNNPYNYG